MFSRAPPRPSTAGGYLTLSSGPPKTQPPEPTPGKPMHAATFTPYSSTTTTTITAGNTKSETSAPKKGAVADILKAPFRRSTSPNPQPPDSDTPAPKTNGIAAILPWVNTNLPPAATPDTRPATSGGESRRSEDRGRRTGRTSVGTSDASELALDSAPAKQWPGGIITKDYAQTALQDPHNPDGTTGAVQTTVTPPTPTDTPGAHFAPKSPVGAVVSKNGQRRTRTNSLSSTPSKLSQSMTAPLTPTSEVSGFVQGSGGSPGGTTGGGGGGGFFQNMFSAAQTAAQTAATSISNTIANTNLSNNGPGGRPRTGTGQSGQSDKETDKELQQGGVLERTEPQRRLAVETLGHGELSLGSLGILPSPKKTGFNEGGSSVVSRATSVGSNMGHSDDTITGSSGVHDDGAELHSAGGFANNTPISAISNADVFESATNSPINGTDRIIRTPVAEDNAFIAGGGHRDSLSGTMTPERTNALATNEIDDSWFGDGDRRRSGSVKSARRKRGSSAASGGALQPVPKPTGFAVASKKRNRDFHALFRSVPEDDYLIEDYGCALQKEILLQGRFYVSEGHICFNSNIFGWINTLVISFDEVVSVEKKSTAMVFPNAIVIQTLHARHVFASFISRDSTYDLIVGIWKIGHPQLVANTTGVRLREGADATVGEDQSVADGGSEYEEDEGSEEYEDGSNDELGESYTDAGDGFLEGSTENGTGKSVSRKVSQQPIVAGEVAGGAVGVDFPGPATHSPTNCADASDHTHYDKPLCDEIIPAPLGRVYSLVFGPDSYPFISRFMAEEEKLLDIQFPEKGEWKDGDAGKKVRSFSYIKPLGGPIGPKQTKCNITETVEYCDLESHVSVVVATQTPDVPSGNVFVVKSKYCLMWGGEGQTRMVATCTVEWSGKSWLKGPIEKGASDGQIAYNADLIAALKKECVPKEPASKGGKKLSKKKRKAMEAKGEAIGRSVAGTVKGREANAAGFTSPAQMEDWGVFAPLKTYLGPVVDILGPLLNGNLGILVICILLTVLVMGRRGGAVTGTEVGRGGVGISARYWEEAWQKEEEGLWEWLEERSGLGGIGEMGRERRMGSFERVLGSRGRVGEGMKQREVEEAIGIMEERLEVLKRVVEGRKGRKEAS